MSYFIDICLICLKHSNNLQYSKSQDTNGISFDNKLEDFIPGYGLDLNIPTYICAQCSRILNKIYDFKRRCLRNKTTYKKYAQQITTTDSSYKYLSVVLSPYLMNVKEELPDETDILEYQTEINVDTANTEEIVIKEEGNEELVLDDKSQSLLHEIKKETSDKLDKSIIEENMQICQNNDEKISNCGPHQNWKLFTCEVCNKSFRKLFNLKQHKLVHTGEKPFTCEVCNKSFRRSSNLKEHKFLHTGEKPLTCEVCNKSFYRSSNLKRHKSVHIGEKPFTCEVCNKSFTQASHLKRHKSVHISEKPVPYDICNKS